MALSPKLVSLFVVFSIFACGLAAPTSSEDVSSETLTSAGTDEPLVEGTTEEMTYSTTPYAEEFFKGLIVNTEAPTYWTTQYSADFNKFFDKYYGPNAKNIINGQKARTLFLDEAPGVYTLRPPTSSEHPTEVSKDLITPQ